MGGNAIQGANRFTREQYPYVIADLEDILRVLGLDTTDYEIVRSYNSKPDFGDIDVLILKNSYSTDKDRLESELFYYYDKIIKNNDVWSIGLELYTTMYEYSKKLIQVDFIFVDNLEIAANYFDWNDLGNLIGRVAHKLGFKYGHEGLKYVFREGTHQYGEEIVSDDTEQILTFLGYSYHRFKEGFDDLEDIFKFVSSSRYFSPDIYLLDNRNNVSRTRDRKRKTYMEFLKWLEGKEFPEPITSGIEKEIVRETHLTWARAIFPKFRDKYIQVEERHSKDKAFKMWWNGDIAKEVTGLEGKELGKFMQEMKVVYNLEACFDSSLDSRGLARVLLNSYI